VTEDEAKTKWCPFARVYSSAENRPNPGPNADTEAGWPPCIGSACMAWRWGEPYAIDEQGRVYHHDRKEDRETGPLTTVDTGYCGLAGKP